MTFKILTVGILYSVLQDLVIIIQSAFQKLCCKAFVMSRPEGINELGFTQELILMGRSILGKTLQECKDYDTEV